MPSENEGLILAALDAVAPGGRHGIVIGEAMRNAALLDVPQEEKGFRAFVEGPLRQALDHLLGDTVAARVLARLLVDLEDDTIDGSGPAGARRDGTTPSQPRQRQAIKPARNVASTLGYGAGARARIDVAIIGADPATQALLREMLNPNDYRLFALDTLTQAIALCEQFDVKVAIAMAEPDGFACAPELRTMLGEATPAVVLLSGQAPLPEIREGVVAVLPKRIDEALLTTIEAAVELA